MYLAVKDIAAVIDKMHNALLNKYNLSVVLPALTKMLRIFCDVKLNFDFNNTIYKAHKVLLPSVLL